MDTAKRRNRAEVLRSVPAANAAFVLGKSYIEDPMQAGLEAPVLADQFGQRLHLRRQAAEKVADLAPLALAGLRGAHDHRQRGQTLPVGKAGQRLGGRQRHVFAAFATTAVGFDGRMTNQARRPNVGFQGCGENLIHRRVQFFVIALERQHVVAARGDGFFGDLFLAA